MLLLIGVVLAGCGPAAPQDDKRAILQVLDEEGTAVVALDIDRLMALWAEDGMATDARHTPDRPEDDLVWEGWDAVRQRYVNTVFNAHPSQAGPLNAEVTLSQDGQTAVVVATTYIGYEVSPQGDRWTLRKVGGAWKITSLTYNLEPANP